VITYVSNKKELQMEHKFTQNKTDATFELVFTASEYEEAMESTFKKEGGKYRVHGFRAGKAPRKMIEKNYGEGVFIEAAIDQLFKQGYNTILDANPEFEPIAPPAIDFDLPKEGGVTMKGTVETIPQFKLGKYTGLEVASADIKITDKQVNEFLEEARIKRGRQVDAPTSHKIVNGDMVTLDFKGSIDGVEFAGGTAEDYELEIGSKSFIDTFEDQLVGLCVGDTKDVKVSFPKEYHAAELAGKPANFAIKIKKIKQTELPKLDDAFAKDTSEFETLADYKKDIKEKLTTSAEAESKQLNEDALIAEVVKQTPVEIPEKMVERQLDMMMNNINHRLSMQGFNLELFAQMQGTTVDAIREQHKESAINTIKTRLVLDEIAKKEKIVPMPEEIEDIIMQAAQKSGRKDKEIRKDVDYVNMLVTNKKYDMITEFLKSKNSMK